MFEQESPVEHSARVGHMTLGMSTSRSQTPSPEEFWAGAKICFVPSANTAALCAIRFSRKATRGLFERHSAARGATAAKCLSTPAFFPAMKSCEGFALENSVLTH